MISIRASRAVPSALAILALLPACGSDDVETPPAPYATVRAFSESLADAECVTVATKCGIDLAGCKTKRTLHWDSVAASRTGRTYESARAPACVDAWKAANSDGELSATELSVTDSTTSAAYLCEKVFEGGTLEKQACAKQFDCADALICDEVGARAAESPKVCAARAEKAAGEFCSNPGDVCAKGTYCKLEGAVASCVAKRSEAESCSDFEPCNESVRCVSGTCAQRLGAGQPCASDDDCRSDAPVCADTGSEKTCVASIAFGTGATVCAPYKT